MKQTYRRTTTQTRDLDKAALLKSHPRTDTLPKNRSASVENPPPGEHLWGTASACKNRKVSKDVNYEKFLFTVVKRNLLTLNMNK